MKVPKDHPKVHLEIEVTTVRDDTPVPKMEHLREVVGTDGKKSVTTGPNNLVHGKTTYLMSILAETPLCPPGLEVVVSVTDLNSKTESNRATALYKATECELMRTQ